MKCLFFKEETMTEDRIKLQIPAKAKYLSLARLAVGGICLEENINIDELEDLRVLITESCNLSFKLKKTDPITIVIGLDKNKLGFTVSGIDKKELEQDKELQMSSLILESLADKVEYRDDCVFVVKELEQ